MLRIERRTAKFGPSLSTRTEKHGEENVIGCDALVKLVVPRARDLVDLLIGEGAQHLLWVDDGGKAMPRFPGIKAIALTERIEEVKVEIWPRGLSEASITFPAANLKRVRIEPLPGAEIELSFLLQANPDGDDHTALVDCLNRDVELQLVCKGFKAQQRLPLSRPDAPVEPAEPAPVNGSDETAAPRRRRRPAQLDA